MKFITFLVSSNAAHFPPLQSYLPDKVTSFFVSSVPDAFAVIDSLSAWQTAVIFFEAPARPIAQTCHELRTHALLSANIPILAILDDPAARQDVLKAGADDYLLHPFSIQEFQARLTPYIRPTIYHPDFLLESLTHVPEGPLSSQTLLENLSDTLPAPAPVRGELLHHVQQQVRPSLPTISVRENHEESQPYTTQTAFMVLVAKMLAEQSDLENILSLTLEHVVSLLHAAGGEIWLKESDNDRLTLVSMLPSDFSAPVRPPVPVGAGLIGWTASYREVLHVELSAKLSQFSAKYDAAYVENGRFLLAVPLYHRETIGVMVVYHTHHTPFTNQDVMLLESIAGLLSSTIANAQLVKELRDYAEQQRVLYKMSQQVTAGLDLQTTFNRTLGWATRLCHVEIGLLWLVDDSQKALTLVASHGLSDLDTSNITIPFCQCLVGWSVANGQAVMSNNPQNDPQYEHTLDNQLQIVINNIMAIPMIYGGVSIGSLSLINKIGDDFNQGDLMLLSTASDMIAVAIGNAHLYTTTVKLMEERERFHQQAIQSERLATVGRLTASLAHEINNPLQAIKGAMVLALEELDDPKALQDYINLSAEQADRVTQLVSRMRQIFRPQSDSLEMVNVRYILQEVIAVSRKEMNRQNVQVQTDFAVDLPSVMVVSNQLHLVFLNIILNFSEKNKKKGGGVLHISATPVSDELRPERVCIEFVTAVSLLPLAGLQQLLYGETPKETGFGLSFSQDIITAYGGTLHLSDLDDQTIFRIELPAS